jgi:hypothetical protein
MSFYIYFYASQKKQQRPAQHARRQPAADPRSRVRVFATESESTADSLRLESSHSCIDVSYSRPGPILADRRSPLEPPACAPNSDRPSRPCLQPAASESDRRSGPGRCCSLRSPPLQVMLALIALLTGLFSINFSLDHHIIVTAGLNV